MESKNGMSKQLLNKIKITIVRNAPENSIEMMVKFVLIPVDPLILTIDPKDVLVVLFY
jgi:hypothetical protein